MIHSCAPEITWRGIWLPSIIPSSAGHFLPASSPTDPLRSSTHGRCTLSGRFSTFLTSSCPHPLPHVTAARRYSSSHRDLPGRVAPDFPRTRWCRHSSGRLSSNPAVGRLPDSNDELTSRHNGGLRPPPDYLSRYTSKRVIVTPAVYPRIVEFLHFNVQSTGQKSHCVNIHREPSQCFVLIRQSDSLNRASSELTVS